MKKFFATLLSLVMILAMSATVFAVTPADYSITVENAKAGETYTAYKMLDLSVDDPEKPTAYRYTVNEQWTAFAATEEFKAVFTVDTQGYVTSVVNSETAWSATSQLSKLAEAAAAYAKTESNAVPVAGSVTIAENAASGKIELTEAGYYVITSTLGTRAMIETTPANSNVTINEKNEGDTVTKTVKEDSTGVYGEKNDAQIGDTVEFKSVVTIVPRSVNVKVHDTMDSGLTLNKDSIKIYTDEALTSEYSGAVVRAGADTTAPDSGDTFTIDIPDTFAATAGNNQSLYIVYTAELNSAAVVKNESGVAIVDQSNKTKVTFGANQTSTESTTTTTTHSVTVFKHANNSTDNLANAIFQLKKGDAVVNLVKLDKTNYRVVDDIEQIGFKDYVLSHTEGGKVVSIDPGLVVSDFITVDSGKITIWGLDSDSDYTLTELQAPNGYNLLASSVPLTYNTDTSGGAAVGFAEADITNMTGAELPSTGGIGTTIFHIIGGVLVLGAVLFFVTRRRMKKDGEVSE